MTCITPRIRPTSALIAAAAALALGALAPTAAAQPVDVSAWMNHPLHKAQKLQWSLAQHMPLDQNFYLVTHNSYNSSAYASGYAIGPQHSYTITQQLNLGIRGFDLDIHEINGGLYLSHATCEGAGHQTGNLLLWQALDEFAAWLDLPENSDEVIIIYIEPWIDTNAGRIDAWNQLATREGFGDRVVRLGELDFDSYNTESCDFGKIKPRDIRAAGRNILLADIGGSGGCTLDIAYFDSYQLQAFVQGPITDGVGVHTFGVSEQVFAVGNVVEVGGEQGTVILTDVPNRPDAIRIDWNTLADGDVRVGGVITNLSGPNPAIQDFIFANFNGGYNCYGQRVWNYVHARDFDRDPHIPNDSDGNNEFDWVDIENGAADINGNGVPDRIEMTYWDVDCIGSRISPSRYHKNSLAVTYGNTSVSEYRFYGQVSAETMRESARAGIDQVRLDPLGTSWAAGIPITTNDAEVLAESVWLWDPLHLPIPGSIPQAASAALTGTSARIRTTSPSSVHRYAEQDVTGEWHITEHKGTFTQYTPSAPGRAFTVPGNGFEMQNLMGAMVRAGATRVWVNYHDQDADGRWTPVTQPRRFYNGATPDPRARVAPVPVNVNSLQLLVSVLPLLQAWATQPAGTVLLLDDDGMFDGSITIAVPTIICPATADDPAAIGR